MKKIKKWLVVMLSAVMAFATIGLVSCGDDTENSSSQEIISSETDNSSSETKESSEENSSSEESETPEGGDGSLVSGFYKFDSYASYKDFYDEFIKWNEERYYAPMVSVGDLIDEVAYIFEPEGIPYEINQNGIYEEIEFPSFQTMSFIFSKEDDSVVGVQKSVLIQGEIFDVSEEALNENVITFIQTDEAGREYNVCLGEVVLCSFEIGITGYDNKAEYLDLIKNGFILN